MNADISRMQPLDFQRVAWFATTWKHDASFSESTKRMAEDLIRLASSCRPSAGASASQDLSVRVITCYLCRFKYEEMPPCCSDVCALYASATLN